MTNAMYGGGIASMMAAKKKAESKRKKKVVAEEDNSEIYSKMARKNDVAVHGPTPENGLHIPPEVAKFLEEVKKEHITKEVTAAFSELMK